MSLFTIVDEAYDVHVERSLKALRTWIEPNSYLDRANETPATPKNIQVALKEAATIYIYEADAKDWVYKIRKH